MREWSIVRALSVGYADGSLYLVRRKGWVHYHEPEFCAGLPPIELTAPLFLAVPLFEPFYDTPVPYIVPVSPDWGHEGIGLLLNDMARWYERAWSPKGTCKYKKGPWPRAASWQGKWFDVTPRRSAPDEVLAPLKERIHRGGYVEAEMLGLSNDTLPVSFYTVYRAPALSCGNLKLVVRYDLELVQKPHRPRLVVTATPITTAVEVLSLPELKDSEPQMSAGLKRKLSEIFNKEVR